MPEEGINETKNNGYIKKFENDGYFIFRSELNYIRKKREKQKKSSSDKNNGTSPNAPCLPGTKHNLVGLCLSGGGIRSATFNLGLLQGLYHQGILNHVDYLSTVSGGGYIGSCLTTLFNSNFQNVQERKNESFDLWKTKYFPFERNIIPKISPKGGKKDPNKGKTDSIEKGPVRHLRYFSNYITAGEDFIGKYFRPLMVFLRGVLLNLLMYIPYLIAGAAILTLLFNFRGGINEKNNTWFFDLKEYQNVLNTRIETKEDLEKFVFEKTADMPGDSYEERVKRVEFAPQYSAELAKLKNKVKKAEAAVNKEWRTLWKIPAFILIIMICIIIFLIPFSICTKNYNCRKISGCWFAGVLFAAALILGLHLYGAAIAYWRTWRIHNGFLLLPLLSLLAPKIIQHLDFTAEQKKKPWVKIIISAFLLSLVPFILLYFTGLIISYLTFTFPQAKLLFICLACFFGALFLIFLINCFIDINKISPHNFYRDRLSKAYLIQHDDTKKEAFYPFAALKHKDSIKLSRLYDNAVTLGPYHLVNTNVNLSKKLPEGKGGIFRNGESFILSKFWCGSEKTGYKATECYEKNDENDDGRDPHMDLGTAMAISGAAVNIGMGHSNMPFLRFLMGFLNIRLGYWARHPCNYFRKRRSKFQSKFPTSWTLLKECIGSYSLDGSFINLSDGGHFDNIGVYELLRRRCKYIIVGDAEADPDMNFQALSYIIRLARIDFGIGIDIDLSDIKPDKNGLSRSHCAVGTIYYPEWKDLPEEHGYLVYCKASLIGSEPHHLIEYKSKHPSFPHQTTADQWFDEQQFEAYRELGYQVGKTAFVPAGLIEQETSLEEVFRSLKY